MSQEKPYVSKDGNISQFLPNLKPLLRRTPMLAVKVHCGSAHVKGTARKYSYFVASLFESFCSTAGKILWRNTGASTAAFRSMAKAEREGRALASQRGAIFVEGYGSLHHQSVDARYNKLVAI